MKVEEPTTVTLYVQWILHPFKTPQTPQQQRENSKWTLEKTKELLEAESINEDDVKLVIRQNGLIWVKILYPNFQIEENGSTKEFWEKVLTILEKSNDVVSIGVYVDNDTSEKIAINLADRVSRPWHTGYQGHDNLTLIYHK